MLTPAKTVVHAVSGGAFGGGAMELRQIRHFLALADHKNFGRAADTLGITQQALSHSIAQMERTLQTRLFERGKFGASLTEIGIAFEKRARLVFAELELATLEVSAMRGGVSGQVRIGVNSVISSSILPPVLKRFAAARPKISVTVTVDHSEVLREKLLQGEIEFGVCTPSALLQGDDAIHKERLGKSFAFDGNLLIMRADHPILRKKKVSLDDVRRYPWIMPDKFSGFTRLLIAHFEKQGSPPPSYILRSDSLLAAMSLLLESDFVALFGRDAISPRLLEGKLVGMPLPGLDFKLEAFLTTRKASTLQPAASEMVRMLRKEVRTREMG